MADIIAFYATDRWGTPKGRINGVSSATRTRKTTGTDTLTLIATTHLIKGDRIIFQDLRGIAHEYIITDYEQSRTDSYTATYYATNSVQELNLTFIEDKRVRGGNASAALTRLLEDTRWQVGTVQAGTLDSTDISFYHVSALKALTDTCTTFGLEIQTELTLTSDKTGIATRAVSLLNHVGSTDRRRYSFGRNLTDVKRRIDATDVYTRLYPYGKGIQSTDSEGNPTGGYGRKLNISAVNDGKTYIEDDTAVQTWGLIGPNGTRVHASTSMDYPDIDDATKLLEAARETLKTLTTPKVSYTATVAVLGVEGESRLGIGVGDDVSLYDETFTPALHVDGRVLEITDNILDPLSDATKITLGNLTDSYTAKRADTDSKITELWNNSGTWNDAATLQNGYVDSIINGLNQQMNVTGGYVYMEPGEGITVYDKPRNQNPTMAIQLGGGYFRIADSKNADGTWDWRTMGTGAGLVADVIVAGTIKGGANYWNLETGDLLFTKGLIHDQANKNVWDLTNSRLVTEAMVATDSILTGEFTSDSDNGDVHINEGIMDILRDVNDESKGVLRFRNAPPLDADGFGIYTQGQVSDLNVYTTNGGTLQMGTSSGSSFNAYVKIQNGTVTIYPRLSTGDVDADSVSASDLNVSGNASFNRIPSISGGASGTLTFGENDILTAQDGIVTDISGTSNSFAFNSGQIRSQLDVSDITIREGSVINDSGDLELKARALSLNAADIYVSEYGDGNMRVGSTNQIIDSQGRTWQFINGICVGQA